MKHVYMMNEQKKNPTNWINTIKNIKKLKNSLFQNFWKIWWKWMNECNLNKKEVVKRSYQVLRKKTLEAFTQKRQKILTKRNWEIEEEDKNNEEQCSDSFYFKVKNDFRLVGRNRDRNRKCFKNSFDWLKGIEPGIESGLEF